MNDSTVTTEPPEPEAERRVVPREVTRDAPSTSAGPDTNQPVVPQKQKKKGKYTGATQGDSMLADSADRRVEPPTKPAGAPKPPPAESSKIGKRKKTVVLDLSTVIPSPAATQVRPIPQSAEH